MIARIKRLKLSPGKRILAVSDVHGNLPYLKGLLQKVGFSEDDILFIVGDLLEKGRHSLDTLRFVMSLCDKYEVHICSGNCDWWYPLFYSEHSGGASLWYLNNKPYNLARQMCAEIGYPVNMETDVTHMRDALARAFPAEFDFLRRMPEVIETERYTFVHGGLPEGAPETWDAWQCMKFDSFMTRGRRFDKWVICGHWPVMLYHEDIVDANPVIDRESRIISIDGGCVLKDDGQLNALVIPCDGSEDFSFEAYDPFPTARVLDAQEASEKSWYIRWATRRLRYSRGTAIFAAAATYAPATKWIF